MSLNEASRKPNLTMAERLEIWKASKQHTSKHDESKVRRIIESGVSDKNIVDSSSSSELSNSKRLKKTVISTTNETTNAPSSVAENSHPNTTADLHKLELANAEIVRLNGLLSQANSSNDSLLRQLHATSSSYDEALINIQRLEISCNESKATARMAQEEIFSYVFENSVQAQKIEELEQMLSKDRLESSENAANKARKHKEDLRKLAAERAEYESRANYMIREVNDQMAMLQQMAMQRIEELERDLMSETTKSRGLEEQIALLKSSSNASRTLTPPRSEVSSSSSALSPRCRTQKVDTYFATAEDEQDIENASEDSNTELDDSTATECCEEQGGETNGVDEDTEDNDETYDNDLSIEHQYATLGSDNDVCDDEC